MKTFLMVAGIVIAVGAVGILLKVVLFPVSTLEKEINTAYDAQSRVLNADNAIYNYEWFKQQYEDIEAAKRQLDNARESYGAFVKDLPVEQTFQDKQEKARLNSVVLGAENRIEQLIADYNARAKMATRNIFINSVLPSYIDALTFITK
jgi:hypothetical protein